MRGTGSAYLSSFPEINVLLRFHNFIQYLYKYYKNVGAPSSILFVPIVDYYRFQNREYREEMITIHFWSSGMKNLISLRST